MCDKCTEIDRYISHLSSMVAQVADAKTLEDANNLIERMKATKATLHRDEPKK